MPIHVRAEQGEYAEACLLPGDPLRAKYIAENYLDDVVQRNSERGLLGYTGTWEGKPVSVQGTGMGCPGATIVFEELVQLGVKKLLRVGTCGGLQPHHKLVLANGFNSGHLTVENTQGGTIPGEHHPVIRKYVARTNENAGTAQMPRTHPFELRESVYLHHVGVSAGQNQG